MATKRPTKRNPAPASAVAVEELVRLWVLRPGGQRIHTVATRTPDGDYVANIAEDRRFAVKASTKRAAEVKILEMYTEHLEDEDDMRVIAARQGEPLISREEFLRQHGRDVSNPEDEDQQDLALIERRLNQPRTPWQTVKRKAGL